MATTRTATSCLTRCRRGSPDQTSTSRSRELREQRLTRGSAVRTIERFERIAATNYAIEFPVVVDTARTRA